MGLPDWFPKLLTECLVRIQQVVFAVVGDIQFWVAGPDMFYVVVQKLLCAYCGQLQGRKVPIVKDPLAIE